MDEIDHAAVAALTDWERDAVFTPLNNAIWGVGQWAMYDPIWGPIQWARCPNCPRDSYGREVYHSRLAHIR